MADDYYGNGSGGCIFTNVRFLTVPAIIPTLARSPFKATASNK